MTWVADSGIGWRILLVADLEAQATDIVERLGALYARQGWGPAPPVLDRTTVPGLTAELTADASAPLLVGRSGPTLVLSAHHSSCDGLGLLTALAALTGLSVTSAARGIDDRPSRSRLAGTAQRLAEALLAPPARVRLVSSETDVAGDSLALAVTNSPLTTADLVLAGVAAVGDLAAEQPTRRDRRVAVAVGVARRAPEGEDLIADRSALLRLRSVGPATPVAELLRTAPVEAPVGGSGTGGGFLDRLATAAMTRLRSRLGSTLLISHLGAVSAPGVKRLAFYPVTAGGSGISLGALTLTGRTVVTARGRAADVSTSELHRLVTAVAGPRPW